MAEAEREPLCSRSAVCSREPPVGDRMECAATGSPVAVAQSIAVAPCSNLDGIPCPLNVRVVSVVSPPPEGVGSPEPVPSDRDASLSKDPGRDNGCETMSLRHVFSQAKGLSALSSMVCVPGTTRSTHASRHCLAAIIAKLPLPST